MTTTTKQKKPLRNVWVMMFLVMFFCCSGSLTSWYAAKRTAQTALSTKVKDLQSRGLPFDDNSLSEYHSKLSSEENAAEMTALLEYFSDPTFRSDCKGLPIVSSSEIPIPKVGKPWTQQADVERLLNKHETKLARLIELTQDNGPIRFPIKFQSYSTLLRSAQDVREVVRVLKLEAIVAAQKSDPEREFRAINGMLGCSVALRGEPMCVSQLVSIACSAIAQHQLRNAVQSNRLLPEHYEQLSSRLSQLSDIGHNYRVGLAGELGACATGMTDSNILKLHAGPLADLAIQTGLAERSAVRNIEYIEKMIQANTDDLGEFQTYVASIEGTRQKKVSIFNIQDSLGEAFILNLNTIADALIQNRMFIDLAILAMAIRRYEYLHGNLPDSLDNLREFGVRPENHRAVDGSVPLYQVVKPSNESQSKIRGAIWSFDNRKTKQISSMMPPYSDEDQQSVDVGDSWWVWYLE